MAAAVPSWTGTTYSPAVAHDLNTIEQAVVAQLAANMPTGVIVEAYPNDPTKYRKRGAAGVVLVRFESDAYGRPVSTGQITQEDTQHWEICVLARNLGWKYGGEPDPLGPGLPLQNIGAYALLDLVRAAMLGFRPVGFKKAFALGRSFHTYEEGWWFYIARFAMPTAVVENWSPLNTPLFVQGTFMETGAITTLAVPTAEYTFNGSNQIALGQPNVSAITVSNISTGAVYMAGVDYSVSTVSGVITALTGGAITAGQTVNVAFSYSEIVTAIQSGGSTPTAPTN